MRRDLRLLHRLLNAQIQLYPTLRLLGCDVHQLLRLTPEKLLLKPCGFFLQLADRFGLLQNRLLGASDTGNRHAAIYRLGQQDAR